jgi:hypothetical protein
VRFATIRGWVALATAILAAVCSDVGTEFAQNSGWLGGGLPDNRHEAVWPALILGLAVTLSLILFVLFARIRPGDPLLSRIGDFKTRTVDIVGSLFGSMLCVVAMEGYETQFGGLSPFDPRSVVLSHALPLLVTFIVVGALVHSALHGAIRVASHASSLVVEAFVQFLNKVLRGGTTRTMFQVSAFVLYVFHVPLAIAHGSRGLRAPPRSILSSYLIT